MAIIAKKTEVAAIVQATNTELSASVGMSAALMEILSTFYKFGLLAAVREAIQNSCDAAKRSGHSISKGVQVLLPTKEDPMITFIDSGSGMTHEFMTSFYLSFGASTKAGDNGSAGGLGVGRWAAYGYIHEAYITTTHESEMIERTYFQYQGEDGTPKVRLASEVEGTVAGTRIFFPVRDSDLREAYWAVGWLKEIMQLTMGDSFSVDKPALIPAVLPKYCDEKFDLVKVDKSLKGVVVYPFQAAELQYSRNKLSNGSVLVMTNKDLGIGGLPFHVQNTDSLSIFNSGMVIEVPMSLGIPFMPSREEVKDTELVRKLMVRIDCAARAMLVTRASELFNSPCLAVKAKLSSLLGIDSISNSFARAVRGTDSFSEAIRKVTGGTRWNGKVNLPAIPGLRLGVVAKHSNGETKVLRAMHNTGTSVGLAGDKGFIHPSTMSLTNPWKIIVNDLPKGGPLRYRKWLTSASSKAKFIYFSSDDMPLAATAANEFNLAFNSELPVFYTSMMPATPRIISGSKVLTAVRGTRVNFYDVGDDKQSSETMELDSFDETEPKKVWLVKDGSSLSGFDSNTTLKELSPYYVPERLSNLLKLDGLFRLYTLTKKQAEVLLKAQTELKTEGLWNASDSELTDAGLDEETCNSAKAFKSWVSFEDWLASLVAGKYIQSILVDGFIRDTIPSNEFQSLCGALAKKPRMVLVGRKFDKAISPYVDILTGTLNLKKSDISDTGKMLAPGLARIGRLLHPSLDDSPQRTELINTLRFLETAGVANYVEAWEKLKLEFPLISTVRDFNRVDDLSMEHFCIALTRVYG